MNELQHLNVPALLLLLSLAAYTWKLVRSNRINTQWGVGWLIVESILIVLCLLRWGVVTDALAQLGGGDAVLGLALLGMLWLALLVLNNHARISKLNGTVKQLSQELALVCERLDRIESEPRGADTGKGASASAAAPAGAAPAPAAAASIPLVRLAVACVWVGAVTYAFAVYTGWAPAQGTSGEVLTSLFATLQAEYLH